MLTLRRDGRRWSAEIRLGELVHGAFHDRGPVAGHVVEGPWSEVLSEAVGQRVRILRGLDETSAFDVHPATILGTASVTELGRRSALGPVDSRRFRMLIELHTQTPHVEDTWTGRRIGIGEAELVVGGPVPRCATVTRHPVTGARDAPIVNAIRAYRGIRESELGPGVNFGVYADVVRPGAVSVGDVVEFLRELSPNPPIFAAPRSRMHGPVPIGLAPSGSPRGCSTDRPWTGPTPPRHPR